MRSPPRSLLRHLSGSVAMMAAAAPAFAHEGHDHGGLLAGLMHPIGGLDHLLATVGIGLVAGLALRGAQGAVGAPVGRGALGAALGLLAGALAAVALGSGAGAGAELAVALGLLALAVGIVRAERAGAGTVALAGLAIALPHGWLHALEGTGAGAGFFAGLGLASVALFAAGALVGRALASRPIGTAAPARWLIASGYLGAFAWFATQAAR
jgi:urease accessory protein